jgi:hypothetical protein
MIPKTKSFKSAELAELQASRLPSWETVLEVFSMSQPIAGKKPK